MITEQQRIVFVEIDKLLQTLGITEFLLFYSGIGVEEPEAVIKAKLKKDSKIRRIANFVRSNKDKF